MTSVTVQLLPKFIQVYQLVRDRVVSEEHGSRKGVLACNTGAGGGGGYMIFTIATCFAVILLLLLSWSII